MMVAQYTSSSAMIFRHTPIGITFLIWVLAGMPLFSQVDSSNGFLAQQEAVAEAWLENLYMHGVQMKGDSVYFNDETRMIASDSTYRALVYPEHYSWEMVAALMQQKALKQAIWYMINLYYSDTTRRDLVLQMILPLDQTLEMDRVLLAAFYTYIAFDPQVYTVKDGKTVDVRRPDIAEHKLLATKAIAGHIYEQRNMQQAK